MANVEIPLVSSMNLSDCKEVSHIWEIFKEITQIPRPSGNEDQIRQFAKEFAIKNRVCFEEDNVGNLVIYVPGNKGYENADTTILQAHMDMVAVPKGEEGPEKKPVLCDLVQDEKKDVYIQARKTSLGADNGIGVAMALSQITDKTAPRGPLEILLTVGEETGMEGAKNLDVSLLHGKYLINLDNEDVDGICVGCAGGVRAKMKMPVQRVTKPSEYDRVVEIEVSGLEGGHSGIDINKKRLNAITTLGEILQLITPECLLIGIRGGKGYNVIPSQAQASVLSAANYVETIQNAAKRIKRNLSAELPGTDTGLKITCRSYDARQLPTKPMSQDNSVSVMIALTQIKNGVLSQVPAGELYNQKPLPRTSRNIGEIETRFDYVEIRMMDRGMHDVDLAKEEEKLRGISEMLEVEYSKVGEYPAWTPNLSGSRLFQMIQTAYRERRGLDPRVLVVHAGLECSLIGKKLPGLDMISYGPTIENAHTVNERLKVNSVETAYKILKRTLVTIAKDSKKK